MTCLVYTNSHQNIFFQSRFKRTDWVNRTNVCRKLIPGFGSCNSKRPSTKVRDSWADDKVAASGRTQSLSAANWCHWLTEIGEICRCKYVQRFKRQQTQLDLDALLDWKPMKAVSQHASNAVVLLGADEQSRRRVQHRLQTIQLVAKSPVSSSRL